MAERTGDGHGRRTGGAVRVLVRCALLAAALAAFFWWSNHALQVTEWELWFPDLPEGFDGFRAVVLSDLHGAEFGPENRDFFERVSELHPEMIFYLGDLEDSYRGSVDGYAEAVADGLTAIAPVWYVTGNHEWAIGYVRDLKDRLKARGVQVLTNDYEYLERNGDVILLAGIDDPNGYYGRKTPEVLAEELETVRPGSFWILLAHRNTSFSTRYCYLGADLVLSGHGHGGLIRLPFTDGLIGVDRSLFPSWTAGVYEKNGTRLFVTRGLGNSGPTFRLFNRPEIAVLTLRRGAET